MLLIKFYKNMAIQWIEEEQSSMTV